MRPVLSGRWSRRSARRKTFAASSCEELFWRRKKSTCSASTNPVLCYKSSSPSASAVSVGIAPPSLSKLGSPGFPVKTVWTGRAVKRYSYGQTKPTKPSQHCARLTMREHPTNTGCRRSIANTNKTDARSCVGPKTNNMALKFCDHRSVCGCEVRIPADKSLCDRCAQGLC
ncbi:hypothetical protein LY76DRAFT_411976 [Colletotrichum caudatum]|nr:hypothetical protein LY76DRAFT_411976 [Colletotrichum caudatum]